MTARRTNLASQLRLRRGTASNRTRANAIPPADRHPGRLFALVGAVVETVSVEVLTVVPLSVTAAGQNEHMGFHGFCETRVQLQNDSIRRGELS